MSGSPDVRIGGAAAARVGDPAQCGNGVDSIAEGEPSVRINNQLAAREGDRHSCGAAIISGCGTVRIGLSAQGECLAQAGDAGAAFVESLE